MAGGRKSIGKGRHLLGTGLVATYTLTAFSVVGEHVLEDEADVIGTPSTVPQFDVDERSSEATNISGEIPELLRSLDLVIDGTADYNIQNKVDHLSTSGLLLDVVVSGDSEGTDSPTEVGGRPAKKAPLRSSFHHANGPREGVMKK